MQVLAPVAGDARPENVVMATLDHIDRIDLHITQMLNGNARGLRPVAKRFANVESLGM
jgi:hypothetical protein